MVRVGICGVTGYAGYEALRWLRRHRDVQIVFATSEAQAGKSLAEVYPGPLDTPLVAVDDAPFDQVDVVLLALPHGAAARVAVKALDAGAKVVDFSADFRLNTPETYAKWYGHAHEFPEMLPIPYGLPEINRANIAGAKLVAAPGCYPTSVILGAMPLLKAGVVTDTTIIVDAKSGISGAGRAPKLNTLFAETHDTVTPYNIGHVHRHVGEIEQELAKVSAGAAPTVLFNPHLIPVVRGMLSALYIKIDSSLSESAVRALYTEAYANEPFVRVLPAGQLAAMAHTTNTNMCAISVMLGQPGTAIIMSSLDNLAKGAATQAIQCMNIICGLDETAGLV
ncbi:MAG: N-acetyl-gamma-glutamyl-phosphate reductase [Chloroflexi bacterium]|nr:N-acetyl-gamma-glutamyl-phosphate reductase [Chloroflexota bacterium]